MENNNNDEKKKIQTAIWNIANELRGAVDGWDFKSYILGFLFYRYISESFEDFANQIVKNANGQNFDYASLSDEKALIGKENLTNTKGYFILPSQLFKNIAKNCENDENLNETLENIFFSIENSSRGKSSEKDLKGLFDDLDLKSNKLGATVLEKNKRLVSIIKKLSNLNMGNFFDNKVDAFGDAYEFLMTMYAKNAGKSGGEFFTPQEVSELLTYLTLIDYNSENKINKSTINKVYDPTCGSGSLLLKFAKVLGKDNVEGGFYGQEINLTTYNLARINMFLHDIDYTKFRIALGDTLLEPDEELNERKPFDAIVSNPPYSIKWDGKNNPILANDLRFSQAGVLAPTSKADWAFIEHSIHYLAPNGTAAIVIFPGILYRSGAEKQIRKYFVEQNYIDSIISLPSDIFFGTSIPTCVIVLRKNKQDNNIMFLNATNEFEREDTKNKLKPKNIENIINNIKERKNIDEISYVASYDEIVKNDFDLSVNTYVGTKIKKEIIDIKKLNQEINEIVAKVNSLRESIDKIVGEFENEN